MKRLLLLLLFFIGLVRINAQLDTEHWFAPMIERQTNGSPGQYLYVSTDEVTPFAVEVYNGTTLLTTLTVSKGNPQKFFVSKNLMIATSQLDVFSIGTKGLRVVGTKKFYANFRFYVTNHAEIITSKGKASLGTKFYAAMAPLTVEGSNLNFMTSFIATEDNTTVTVSGYNPFIVFSDNTTKPTITVTLNRGQSYIIDGRTSQSVFNLDGFIGAKIVSDKPISVTNGNFNGQYASFSASDGSDILMDQSVPADRLGKEFVLVKGNGPNTSEMEGALVVATENNTKVYLNDNPNPIAVLNEGKYYYVNQTNHSNRYINQGNNHYNMYLKTDKNVYVYQLLAGADSGSLVATGGFNYIPPLNCYLPNTIGEIGLISEMGTSPGSPFPTKLNIITEKGAVVTVNGATLSAVNGPYNVTGTLGWETYSVPNVNGNYTITSTKAVTAGLSAGSNAVGYGGYFAGFSSIPVITKITGTCIPGIVLEVNSGFTSYQWLLNGVAIPGANSNTFTPTVPGNYTVRVTNGTCEPVITPVYKVLNCLFTSNQSFITCNAFNVSPTFTTSLQPVNPGTVVIVTPPTQGTTSINPTTGQITYTANVGASGTDSFVYKFCGNVTDFQDCEQVTVNITIGTLAVNNTSLTVCKVGTQGTFNLTSANVTPTSPVNKKYYPTLLDAQTDNAAAEITNPTAYVSSGGSVFVKIVSPEGCKGVAEIQLNFYPTANLDVTAYNATHCDDDLNGSINIDFSTITPIILENPSYFTVKYYLNLSDANAGNTNTLPNNWTYTANTTVYVRVESPDGCLPVIKPINFVIGNKIPLATLNATHKICDNNLDNTESVNLSSYLNSYTTDAGVSATFHATLADAQLGVSPIPAVQTITGNKTFYIRFTKTGVCPNAAVLNIIFNQPSVSTSLPSSMVICEGTLANVNAGNGFSAYSWSNGATTPNNNLAVGNHYVDLTSANGCIHRQFINITSSPLALLNTSSYNGTHCDDDLDGTINIDLSTVTPVVLTNHTLFTVKYYSSLANANAGNTSTLANNWSYSTDTTIYIRVESSVCPPMVQPINFKIGNKVSLLTLTSTEFVCDDDLDGVKSVNLSSYNGNYTADAGVNVTYYTTLSDAKQEINAVSSSQTITNSKKFYLRFEKAGVCPNIAEITVNIKTSKASTTLKNAKICPEDVTTLNAGSGFSYYTWSNGQSGPNVTSITVPVGEYWVDLTFNGCVYRQFVTVSEAELPVITSILIEGNTVTLTATGGTQPYQYSIDGVNYQASNVFTNVSFGVKKAYVKNAENCDPTIKDFALVKLVNVITPNDDGYNDVLDYSALQYKNDVKFVIFDRYGAVVYVGDALRNFTWDGKVNGRPVPTATYWYTIEWKDFGSNIAVKQSGWILVKNRGKE